MQNARWSALAVGTFAQAMFSAVFVVVPVLLPFLQDRFGLSLQQVGLALASINFGMIFSLVGWGQLADRIGDRPVMVAGLAGAAISFGLAAKAASFPALLAAFTCAGALGASVNASSTRAVMGWFPPHERGLALGIRQTAIPLGGALFALLLPPIATRAGTEGGFLLLSGVIGAAALAATRLRRPPEAPSRHLPAAGLHPLRDRAVWRVALGGGLMLWGQAVLVGYLVLLLHDHRHVGAGAAAGVLAVAQVLGAALLILCGRWSDAAGSRLRPLRALGVAGALTMLAVASTTGAPLLVLVPTAVVATATSLSWVGLCSAAAGEVAAAGRSGAAMGLQQALMAISATLAPLGFSAILSAGSWPLAFACAAVAPLLGTLLLRSLREPQLSR